MTPKTIPVKMELAKTPEGDGYLLRNDRRGRGAVIHH